MSRLRFRLHGVRPSRLRVAVAGAGGLLAGSAVAALALLGTPDRAVGNANDRPSASAARLIDAAHVPPLLTVPGESVSLRYDVYCPAPDGPESGAPCDADGTVFVRKGNTGGFAAIPLVRDERASEGRYAARVPDAITSSADGFSYYAVVRNRAAGTSLTLPGGGPAAPQRSLPLVGAVDVRLGAHSFGRVREADARVLATRWGGGSGQAGLESGPETQPIGPSAFDVDEGGTVSLLDQVNRRVLKVDPRSGATRAVPVAVNGTIADLAVADDGAMWVLETAGARAPLLREFGPYGAPRRAIPLAERTASHVRLGPVGPVVKQYPSEEWLPAIDGRSTLGRAAQRARGESARPLEDGRRVAVLVHGDELRVALLRGDSVQHAWRIHSETPLAEVQLAEPLGERLVVVVRAYTEARDEFVVLVLARDGLVADFAVDSADWAETAPVSRFRLAGGSLFQLGSTPAGLHVDRFDLEVM